MTISEKWLLELASVLRQQIKDLLNQPLSWAQKKKIMQRYLSAIHPHFIVWVAGMENSCSTQVCLFAAMENIQLEIKENHQQMLFQFMKKMDIHFDPESYDALEPYLAAISGLLTESIRRKNGLMAAMVIFLLEETSKEFIPWMEQRAIERGVTNLVYTQKHGEADEEHARKAMDAVLAEADALLGNSDAVSYAASLLMPQEENGDKNKAVVLGEKSFQATSELLLAIFSI